MINSIDECSFVAKQYRDSRQFLYKLRFDKNNLQDTRWVFVLSIFRIRATNDERGRDETIDAVKQFKSLLFSGYIFVKINFSVKKKAKPSE